MSNPKFDEAQLTMMFHSRVFTIVVALVAFIVAIVMSNNWSFEPFAENRGIAFDAVGSYSHNSVLSFVGSCVITFGTALVLIFANGKFSIIKGFSFLFAALFLIAMMCCPPAMCFLYGGDTFCLLNIISATLLISAYQHPDNTKEVFLAFCLLSLGACFHWGQIVLIAVFVAGCGQMMIFKPRILIAAIFGIVTPLWILLGFGIISVDDLKIPTSLNTIPFDNPAEISYVLAYTAFSAFLCVVFGILNLLKFLSADTRTRSVNGFIFLLTLTAVILAAADYANLPIYIPFINCCAALQVGQFFTVTMTRRSYIPIIIICITYIALLIFGVVSLSQALPAS